MLRHASAAMTLEVHTGLFNPDSTTWPNGSTKRPERRGGVSRVCPELGSKGVDKVADENQDDDDDGLCGVARSCALTWSNNRFRSPGGSLLELSVPPE